MQERFPLTEDLWLDWLADEAESGAEPSAMTELYDLAVGDYLSIPLWADYVRCVPAPAHECCMHTAARHAASDITCMGMAAGMWAIWR